jgi:ABC-2 type transport system permease protein
MKKYLRIFLYAARDQIAYMPSFLVRNVFFIVIVFVFWSLWRVVFGDKPSLAGLSLAQTLWYLTFTETIELSKSRVLFQVQEEVKDGTLAVTLSRPYSYVLFHLSRCMGESCVKIFPLLVEGFLLATLFVGPLPNYFRALPFGLVLIVAGLLITNLWLLAIGLISFWSEEVLPFYWIVQKLVFILGGLFIPIDMFPEGLAKAARLLPFAFCAYWPAYTMVSFSAGTFLTALSGAAVYAAALGGLTALLYARGRMKVGVQGG